MPNLGPVLLGGVSRGESVDFFGIAIVIALIWLEPKGRVTSLTPVVATVVGGTYFSNVAPSVETVFGLLVCILNSSDDTSVTGGDDSCWGLFSLGT